MKNLTKKILKHDDEVLHKEIKTLRNELQGLQKKVQQENINDDQLLNQISIFKQQLQANEDKLQKNIQQKQKQLLETNSKFNRQQNLMSNPTEQQQEQNSNNDIGNNRYQVKQKLSFDGLQNDDNINIQKQQKQLQQDQIKEEEYKQQGEQQLLQQQQQQIQYQMQQYKQTEDIQNNNNVISPQRNNLPQQLKKTSPKMKHIEVKPPSSWRLGDKRRLSTQNNNTQSPEIQQQQQQYNPGKRSNSYQGEMNSQQVKQRLYTDHQQFLSPQSHVNKYPLKPKHSTPELTEKITKIVPPKPPLGKQNVIQKHHLDDKDIKNVLSEEDIIAQTAIENQFPSIRQQQFNQFSHQFQQSPNNQEELLYQQQQLQYNMYDNEPQNIGGENDLQQEEPIMSQYPLAEQQQQQQQQQYDNEGNYGQYDQNQLMVDYQQQQQYNNNNQDVYPQQQQPFQNPASQLNSVENQMLISQKQQLEQQEKFLKQQQLSKTKKQQQQQQQQQQLGQRKNSSQCLPCNKKSQLQSNRQNINTNNKTKKNIPKYLQSVKSKIHDQIQHAKKVHGNKPKQGVEPQIYSPQPQQIQFENNNNYQDINQNYDVNYDNPNSQYVNYRNNIKKNISQTYGQSQQLQQLQQLQDIQSQQQQTYGNDQYNKFQLYQMQQKQQQLQQQQELLQNNYNSDNKIMTDFSEKKDNISQSSDISNSFNLRNSDKIQKGEKNNNILDIANSFLNSPLMQHLHQNNTNNNQNGESIQQIQQQQQDYDQNYINSNINQYYQSSDNKQEQNQQQLQQQYYQQLNNGQTSQRLQFDDQPVQQQQQLQPQQQQNMFRYPSQNGNAQLQQYNYIQRDLDSSLNSSNFSMFNPNEELKVFFQNEFGTQNQRHQQQHQQMQQQQQQQQQQQIYQDQQEIQI